MVMNIMALDQGASAWFTKEVILGGGIGIFGFAVLILFFGFCARKLRFSVLAFIAVSGVSIF